jgi:type II secretory ATPase GspE/PulE/Tfp pilus assembly ATPase PilB-like protein
VSQRNVVLSPLVKFLLAKGLLERDIWLDAVARSKVARVSWLAILLGYRGGDVLVYGVADFYQLRVLDCAGVALDSVPSRFWGLEAVRCHDVLPVVNHDKLTLVVLDPGALDWFNLGLFLPESFVLALALPSSWPGVFERLASYQAGQLLAGGDEVKMKALARGGDFGAEQSSMKPYLLMLLAEAQRRGSSDIHIEAGEAESIIRFRVDGLLQHFACISLQMSRHLLVCIKVLAQLDVTEVRLPQDGRLSVVLASGLLPLMVRVSTCPGIWGEKMVLRLLAHSALKLSDLGLLPEQRGQISRLLGKPEGLVVVVGPTGSGKTSTLYALLSEFDCDASHIMTVEDPVEVILPGVHQILVNEAIGLGFARILPYLLRQDPDIILVGEIRDAMTASFALEAAQTGHLVLTTLHAGSVGAAVVRLQQLLGGREDLVECLRLLIAQRLLRRVCLHCDGLFAGCNKCVHGYLGRIGVFDVCAVEADVRAGLLAQGGVYLDASEGALLCKARELLAAGLTLPAELQRVFGE